MLGLSGRFHNFLEDAMKIYRIEFAGGNISFVVSLIVITIGCLTIIGIPAVIALLPTMYQIVEDYDVSAVGK